MSDHIGNKAPQRNVKMLFCTHLGFKCNESYAVKAGTVHHVVVLTA